MKRIIKSFSEPTEAKTRSNYITKPYEELLPNRDNIDVTASSDDEWWEKYHDERMKDKYGRSYEDDPDYDEYGRKIPDEDNDRYITVTADADMEVDQRFYITQDGDIDLDPFEEDIDNWITEARSEDDSTDEVQGIEIWAEEVYESFLEMWTWPEYAEQLPNEPGAYHLKCFAYIVYDVLGALVGSGWYYDPEYDKAVINKKYSRITNINVTPID